MLSKVLKTSPQCSGRVYKKKYVYVNALQDLPKKKEKKKNVEWASERERETE